MAALEGPSRLWVPFGSLKPIIINGVFNPHLVCSLFFYTHVLIHFCLPTWKTGSGLLWFFLCFALVERLCTGRQYRKSGNYSGYSRFSMILFILFQGDFVQLDKFLKTLMCTVNLFFNKIVQNALQNLVKHFCCWTCLFADNLGKKVSLSSTARVIFHLFVRSSFCFYRSVLNFYVNQRDL